MADASERSDFCSGLFQIGASGTVIDDKIGSVLSELQGTPLADPASGSGHQCHLARERDHHPPISILEGRHAGLQHRHDRAEFAAIVQQLSALLLALLQDFRRADGTSPRFTGLPGSLCDTLKSGLHC